MFKTYADAIAALYGRINYERLGTDRYTAADLKLERMRYLLERLGNPHREIPVYHVAGTKGKGPVCSYVANILQAAGYKTGLYTSPHLHRVEERLRINGQCPTEVELVVLCEELFSIIASDVKLQGRYAPTFFECLNALAWMFFRAQSVAVAVLEVGLGGRLDSTNCCQPLVTAITSISFDHMKILGHTLREIAGEKAGIIKAGIPVVSGVENAEARQRIQEQADQLHAPLDQWQVDFQAEIQKPWLPDDRTQTVRLVTPANHYSVDLTQPGRVYALNAAIACRMVELGSERGFPVQPEQIKQGLEMADLPLRFEILQEQPLLIADSAHNGASVQALLATVQQSFPDRKTTVLLAVSRDKDIVEICRSLAVVDRIIVSQYSGNMRAFDRFQLLEILKSEFTGEILLAEDAEAAWKLAQHLARPEDLFLATGSLFFAAEIRQHILAGQTTSAQLA